MLGLHQIVNIQHAEYFRSEIQLCEGNPEDKRAMDSVRNETIPNQKAIWWKMES